MKTIMVVDDEKDIRDSLSGVLRDEGYDVAAAGSAEDALKQMEAALPELVLLDIWLPGMDGTEALKQIKALYPLLPVIMISGHANIETAVKTTKLGAYDFIEKPLSLDKVVLTVQHALERKSLIEENRTLKQKELAKYRLVGGSDSMQALKRDIERAAPSNGWVLITGENGTGKEYVARNIHLLSNRAAKPFIEVNCAAIPEELIESELFGHEKGAFTSAVAQKKGKFDLADKGTIFLDEIGDMSLKTQAKVLRILQEQTFERVGGVDQIKVDVRVIAATNKDLREQITRGAFREDLFYRLNVIPFHIPPLRERTADIPLFVEHFLKDYAAETAKGAMSVSEEAMSLFLEYRWPGNVRELKNLVERLVIMTPGNFITVNEIPSSMLSGKAASRGETGASTQSADLFKANLLREARRDFEREFILRKLKEFGGNISKTAEAMGIERTHLHRKIRNYGLDV